MKPSRDWPAAADAPQRHRWIAVLRYRRGHCCFSSTGISKRSSGQFAQAAPFASVPIEDAVAGAFDADDRLLDVLLYALHQRRQFGVRFVEIEFGVFDFGDEAVDSGP